MKLFKKIADFQAILSKIRVYQFVTKAGIIAWLFVLKRIFRLLLKSTGRVAVTSGDFAFLFSSWQGPLILIVGLFSLFIYVAFDLNAKIILSGKLIEGEKDSVWASMKESFLSMKKFLNPRGIWIILYISLIAPLVGVGFSISMTSNFYVPTFITSVIYSSPLYAPLYGAVMLCFAVFGLANIFILHGVLLEDMTVKEAGTQSKALMKAHWKDYFLQTLRYVLRLILFAVLAFIVVLIIPMVIVKTLAEAGTIGADTERFLTIFVYLIMGFIYLSAGLVITPMYILEITRRFYMYKTGEEISYPAVRNKKWHLTRILMTAASLLVVASISAVLTIAFDTAFPAEITTRVVAHRAGGVEAPENTVAGLKAAWEAGAYGAEIDIHRTSDGYYVVNHDNTFSRTAGVNKEPSEMTLEEVKQLRVEGEPVAELEEMLDYTKGKLVLFVELKGKTADTRMADDAVRIIKERGMEDEVVLISLKYDIVDYIETKYPEIQTGYLAFASFGNTASLNCDYLALEEQLATSENIQSIHDNGRKVMIWTVNSEESQERFLCSSADAIITDEVVQAGETIKKLEARTDEQRLLDMLFKGL